MTLKGTVWAPMGPSPISQSARQDNGLTSAIAINPDDGNVIYQGTAGGGVWRTLDGGAMWTPIFDRQTSLGIGEPGAIAIDPNDTSIILVGNLFHPVLRVRRPEAKRHRDVHAGIGPVEVDTLPRVYRTNRSSAKAIAVPRSGGCSPER